MIRHHWNTRKSDNAFTLRTKKVIALIEVRRLEFIIVTGLASVSEQSLLGALRLPSVFGQSLKQPGAKELLEPSVCLANFR